MIGLEREKGSRGPMIPIIRAVSRCLTECRLLVGKLRGKRKPALCNYPAMLTIIR